MNKKQSTFWVMAWTALISAVPMVSLAFDDASRLASGEWVVTGSGLSILDANKNTVFHQEGAYDALDVRTINDGASLIAVSQTQNNHIELFKWHENRLEKLGFVNVESDAIESVCLHQDVVGNDVYAFILKTREPAEQRLVFDASTQQAKDIKVRSLPASFGLTGCAVDDIHARLYIAEENIGIWQFDAHPEAELGKTAIEMHAPFGQLTSDIKDITLLSDGSLLVSQPDEQKLARLSFERSSSTKGSAKEANNSVQIQWQNMPQEKDRIAGYWSDAGRLKLLVENQDSSGSSNVALGEITFDAATNEMGSAIGSASNKEKEKNAATALSKKQVARTQFSRVKPSAETKPVARYGDAADDPAIWVHPTKPEKSLVLGTDKKSGLGVYDLSGNQRQFIASGRINNVDLRQGFTFGDETFALAAASQRDRSSIVLYRIDNTGFVTEVGEVATSLNDVYGLCMFTDKHHATHYVFINDKDGHYQQYLIQSKAMQNGTELQGKLVREFRVQDQPEGCAANDENGELFVGVEDHGIWVTSAYADMPATLKPLVKVGGNLQDDVEGIDIYQNQEESLLVVSSQGNDSYAIFSAVSPYSYKGSFQVQANAALGIDGASETDGLAVTSVNLGAGYERGLLVVQDGRNVMPEAPQNFKLVPFSAVLKVISKQ
ncbi:phytase [Alteromonas sp. a30]|uniref:phytase n=1 Tax=Alteromonas sp. a30 TaxID=2730917 RepID=UPI002281B082|nr:phytase [Alteromonas sp. a30]MCY7296310.1 phytase [Alteromonas sp. a30]